MEKKILALFGSLADTENILMTFQLSPGSSESQEEWSTQQIQDLQEIFFLQDHAELFQLILNLPAVRFPATSLWCSQQVSVLTRCPVLIIFSSRDSSVSPLFGHSHRARRSSSCRSWCQYQIFFFKAPILHLLKPRQQQAQLQIQKQNQTSRFHRNLCE